MLNEVMEIFEKEYSEKQDKLITDSYILSVGTYVKMNLDGNYEIFEIDKNFDKDSDIYEYFRERDYYSTLIDMNKPIDPKKKIHSNQIYSFFVKKEILETIDNAKKLTNEIINKYYEILSEPEKKYSKNAKEIFLGIEKKDRITDKELVQKIKNSIINNLDNIREKYKRDKNYLKIFIDTDIEEYKKEQKKYLLPNIYNTVDYNEKLENNKIYGLPNNNMQLNSKKIYLKNKTRKNEVPILVSTEKILLQNNLFKYLFNCANEGRYDVYFDNLKDEIISLEKGKLPDREIRGYYLRLKKGKEVEIHDIDIVTEYSTDISIILHEYLEYEKKDFKFEIINYGEDLENLKRLSQVINEVLFNKYLNNNYYSTPKDIKIYDENLKQNLLFTRKAFHTWFYKGNDTQVKQIWDKLCLSLIKHNVLNKRKEKAIAQFNLFCELKKYFNKGENKMADILQEKIKLLKEKLDSGKDDEKLYDDSEYFIAMGQAAGYLIDKSLSSRKEVLNGQYLRNLLNIKNDKKLKSNLKRLLVKYSYAAGEFPKFKKLTAMVEGYVLDNPGVINEDLIIAGYLHKNIMYMKKENK
ncbi:hypothetical protein EII29_08750 [Leptotrichia sp. OH3620_COT-345]|uniref:hypothetical protein n=1 Tax=Leptotrichia sp. OH3620_COT-345 TaxID=2491048 RepID=UPI000F64EE1D|nr:hypothetical protein [Leptotrichia sp. OH3620_COT-345]RRD39068.1 hypothetical protein EII29_08750 [Leptotrichia sp. OH3620_COT-345]